MTQPSTGVLYRANDILRAVAVHPRGLTLADVALATGLTRPTAHRIARDLIEIGFLVLGEGKRYRIGPALAQLSMGAPSPLQHVPEISHICSRVAERLGETVYAATRYFDGVYYLARSQSQSVVEIRRVGVGDIHPLSSTYCGLALLSQLPADERESAIRYVDYSEFGFADQPVHQGRDVIDAALSRMEVHGYLYAADLTVPGLAGASVLVPAADGPSTMALSISTINSRLTPDREDEVIGALQDAAAEIAALEL